MSKLGYILSIFCLVAYSYADDIGCMNPDACNFDPDATVDDGSCEGAPGVIDDIVTLVNDGENSVQISWSKPCGLGEGLFPFRLLGEIDDIEIERVTPAAMKQMYRDMAKGKEAEKEVEENKKMDALKLALAKHKFKDKGGKVDKQPDSMEKPYGKLSKDDLERAKAIAQYKKDKKKKK